MSVLRRPRENAVSVPRIALEHTLCQYNLEHRAGARSVRLHSPGSSIAEVSTGHRVGNTVPRTASHREQCTASSIAGDTDTSVPGVASGGCGQYSENEQMQWRGVRSSCAIFVKDWRSMHEVSTTIAADTSNAGKARALSAWLVRGAAVTSVSVESKSYA
eukprot:3168039-Rhodomonas_salina.2